MSNQAAVDLKESQRSATDAKADPRWDDWDAPPRVPEVPVLHLDGFDGPMDLLLDLAERQRIDLRHLSPRDMVEQFVAEMQRLETQVPIERRADWLVLATRLVLLRSRLVFPANPQEAAAAERDAARQLRNLNELAAMRAAARWLEATPQLGRDVFERVKARNPRTESHMALMEACLVVLQGKEGKLTEMPVYRPAITGLWRVIDALARIRRLLLESPAGAELKAFIPAILPEEPNRTLKARAAVASSFLAALELTHAGEITVEQIDSQASITLRRSIL